MLEGMDEFKSFTLDQIQTMLDDAIKSRHQLATNPSSAASHNRSIAYQQRIIELDDYIRRLNNAVEVRQNPARMRRRPFYISGVR